MILNIKYIWLICFFCTSVCAGHVKGDKKCSQFDLLTRQMEQSAQLRIEVANLEKTIETLEATVEGILETLVQRKRVAFCAGEIDNVSPALGDNLLFNDIDMNEGATYHPSTGTFNAVYPGLYQFSTNFCNAVSLPAVVGIKHNDEVLVTSTTFENTNSGCSTVSTYIVLKPGDTVSVVSSYPTSRFRNDEFRRNTFCGHRIDEIVMSTPT